MKRLLIVGITMLAFGGGRARADQSSPPIVLQPAPRELKTKLTPGEMKVFVALAKKASAHGVLWHGRLVAHEFVIQTQVPQNGSVELTGITLGLVLDPAGIAQSPELVGKFSISAQGDISNKIALHGEQVRIEDPRAQKLILEEIAVWMNYAKKKGLHRPARTTVSSGADSADAVVYDDGDCDPQADDCAP